MINPHVYPKINIVKVSMSPYLIITDDTHKLLFETVLYT